MIRPTFGLFCATTGCGAPLDLGTDIVWSADHESGDLSAWTGAPGVGGVFGGPSVSISSAQAHTGRYSAKISSTAATPDPTGSLPAGAGLYKEATFPQEAYYSVWYYLPRAYQTLTSWTILKFETPSQAPSDAGVALTQLLDVRIQSLPSGDMTLVVFDHRQQYLQSPLPNPPPLVPVGRWFQLESFYRNADDASGHFTVWLDGTLIYDLSRPTGSDGSIYFAPCSLADNLSPSSVELYIDDVAVSWRRMTPQGVLKLN